MDMHTTPPSNAHVVHHITGVDYFDPDITIITTLKRALTNAQNLMLRIEGVGELLLLSNRGEYFSRITDERAFFCTPRERVEISVLSGRDKRVPSTDKVGRNVDELMWKAAFHSSQGRLLQGCYPVDMVELDYWPNLTRLPHTPNSQRIASLLSRHPASIAFAARLLHIAPEEIYQFYSAARCAGWARPVNRTPEEPKLEPHRNQTLLSALMKKISSL